MSPATNSSRRFGMSKLLICNDNKIETMNLQNIVNYFHGNEILVVNYSGTIPASFQGEHIESGSRVEVRLASFQGPGIDTLENWLAIVFGDGNWRTPTESRIKPPRLKAGDCIKIGMDLTATIKEVKFENLIKIKFKSNSLEKKLYEYGSPIQYSYLEEEISVLDQQTIFSGPPISVEAPSASFNFYWDLIFKLQKKGVEIIPILHGGGLSSTGNSVLDEKLPFPEWSSISQEAALKIQAAKYNHKKVIALGTTVVRALESFNLGESGFGLTDLHLSSKRGLKVVDGLITGMHETGSSHLELLSMFCDRKRLDTGYDLASKSGFLMHEYGDLAFLQS